MRGYEWESEVSVRRTGAVHRGTALIVMLTATAMPPPASAQVLITGRLTAPPVEGAAGVPLTSILVVASPAGPEAQPAVTRTRHDELPWEPDPIGGWRVSGPAGRYTLAFAHPAHFLRPIVRTNQYARDGDSFTLNLSPRFDVAMFDESSSDDRPARGYIQLFTACSTSLTHLGFKPVEAVSGGNASADRDLLVSVHRVSDGPPETWPQVGPAGLVPFKSLHAPVERAGARDFPWSLGWLSGEVPLEPGRAYGVFIRPRSPQARLRMFWRPAPSPAADCYRIGDDGTGIFAGRQIWMAVGGDGDGLLIPYGKRIHREFGEQGGFRPRWSQTYVPAGRGLAAVVLYAAGTTEQIPLRRQRAIVRVRRGGPAGPVVGIEKIARGEGEWTGDASWGVFAAAFAPGEVPLTPGETYAIEFETLENYNTLHGFINIKNVPSGDRGGLSPYLRPAADPYEAGQAWQDGRERLNADLDMMVIEYAAPEEGWAARVEPENLLVNGDLREGGEDACPPAPWKAFTIDPATELRCPRDAQVPPLRVLQVIGGSLNGRTADGGFVQRVGGLDRACTYRPEVWVRCSHAVDVEHQCFVGVDPTGQTDDPRAGTIAWTPLPAVGGQFVPHRGEPVRPAAGAVSLWLRARTTSTAGSPIVVPLDPFGFRAEFSAAGLYRVDSGVPRDPLEGDPEGEPSGLDAARLERLEARVRELMQKLPRRPVMSGRGMPTKLGLYYFLGYQESPGFFELADTGCVPLVRTIGQAFDRAWRVAEKNPRAILVVGTGCGDGEPVFDASRETPARAAERNAAIIRANLAHVPEHQRARVDFIECLPIMWEPKDHQTALWFSEYLCELLPRIADLGPRPVVLNTGIGGAPIRPDILAGMVPGLRLAHHLGGAWGSHGYSARYVEDERLESFYSLRYRRVYKFLERHAPDIADLPVYLPEGGIDEIGDAGKSGWQARGPIEKYARWLAWYDRELRRDDRVLGVTLFKIGTPPEWKSFDLEPMTDWLGRYYRSTRPATQP